MIDLKKVNQNLIAEYGFLKIQEEIIKARLIAIGKEITLQIEREQEKPPVKPISTKSEVKKSV